MIDYNGKFLKSINEYIITRVSADDFNIDNNEVTFGSLGLTKLSELFDNIIPNISNDLSGYYINNQPVSVGFLLSKFNLYHKFAKNGNWLKYYPEVMEHANYTGFYNMEMLISTLLYLKYNHISGSNVVNFNLPHKAELVYIEEARLILIEYFCHPIFIIKDVEKMMNQYKFKDNIIATDFINELIITKFNKSNTNKLDNEHKRLYDEYYKSHLNGNFIKHYKNMLFNYLNDKTTVVKLEVLDKNKLE